MIVLDKPRALVIVTLAFGSAAWVATLLLRFVETTGQMHDLRLGQATTAFTVIVGLCWLMSAVSIIRRR
jgi:hypothetical protein